VLDSFAMLQPDLSVTALRALRHSCPICVGARFISRFPITRGGETFRIVACVDCGFNFVVDPPVDTASHVKDGQKLVWRFRPRHDHIRRLLLSRLKPGSSVIEIGCGRGELGYLMRNDPIDYVGYEPARGLADFGINEGVNIVRELYHGSRLADAVVLDNVIEHVTEPAQMIKTAAKSLNPDGLLIVIAPNVNDVRRVSPAWCRKHLWVPPDHINYFSARDISRMFHDAGLVDRRFQFEPLRLSDWKYFPRALAECVGLSIFGHNVFACRVTSPIPPIVDITAISPSRQAAGVPHRPQREALG
jgi:SAM-dependent methyltransferase